MSVLATAALEIPASTVAVIGALAMLAIVLANIISKLVGHLIDRVTPRSKSNLLDVKLASMCESTRTLNRSLAVLVDQHADTAGRIENMQHKTDELHEAHLGPNAKDADGRPKWWVPHGAAKRLERLDQAIDRIDAASARCQAAQARKSSSG